MSFFPLPESPFAFVQRLGADYSFEHEVMVAVLFLAVWTCIESFPPWSKFLTARYSAGCESRAATCRFMPRKTKAPYAGNLTREERILRMLKASKTRQSNYGVGGLLKSDRYKPKPITMPKVRTSE